MATPFDDIRTLLADLPGPDQEAAARAGSGMEGLGLLAGLASWLASWTGRTPPQVLRPVIALYAGAHGSAGAETGGEARTRLEAFAAGTAPINAMAQHLGAGMDAFDLALDRPVPDIARRAAMTERECAATIAFGMEALAKTPDLLLLDTLGEGGGTAAAAIAHALHGETPGDWIDDGQEQVAAAVERATGEGATDPLELLRQLGGREIAAAAGAILAARVQRTPVVLGGYTAAAAGAVLQTAAPRALDHCLAAEATSSGHRRLLGRLGLSPLLDLSVSQGEGTGAVSVLPLLRLACAAAG
jgi:nicotinate-nucleotide--dimethylbenzimidazole phosphoribosyltransferase